jgi:hypothetical protein
MFPGGHDYSRPMREAALGFFDKYLKGEGDGSPLPEPAFETAPPDAPEMCVLPDPPARTLTMRGIARAMFEDGSPRAEARVAGTAADYIALNGGLPVAVPFAVREVDAPEGRRRAVFVSEDGLTLPALLWAGQGDAKAAVVFVSERGKSGAADEFPVDRLRRAGITVVALDPRGLGEAKGLNLRLQTYLGQAPAFGMGWDIARAIAAFVPENLRAAVVGRGPAAGQAALVAALIEPRVGFVAGLATLREFQDAFRDDVPLIAIQPRACYAPSLLRLRALVKAESVWGFLGGPDPDWAGALIRWADRTGADRP